MKAIISHDVDHLTAWEHHRDLIIPKFLVRSGIELARGGLKPYELYHRIADTLKNRWQNLEALMQFNQQQGVPATFFFGVARGLGMAYSIEAAKPWIRRVLENGFEVGVHGIAYDSLEGVKREYEAFQKISGLREFGIRMHYLRTGERTLEYLNKAGYLYDASIYDLGGPYTVGKMIEFPLHIMDCYVMEGNSRFKTSSLNHAMELTKQRIDLVSDQNLPYLTVLFHDHYFCKGYEKWQDWYKWIIKYLMENNITFVTFHSAVKEYLQRKLIN
jgi:peptidoglycan/xylan/chitin deacetylase (PgdA/CDA1 family)